MIVVRSHYRSRRKNPDDFNEDPPAPKEVAAPAKKGCPSEQKEMNYDLRKNSKASLYDHVIRLAFWGALLFCSSVVWGEATDSVCPSQTQIMERYPVVGGSELTFRFIKNGKAQWICLDNHLLIESRKDEGYGIFDLVPLGLTRGVNDIEYKNGLITRVVVQESSGPHIPDNRYWIIDFRTKDPLIVGPFGRCDSSDEYLVRWRQNQVEIFLGPGEENAAQSFVYSYKKHKILDTSPIDVCKALQDHDQ